MAIRIICLLVGHCGLRAERLESAGPVDGKRLWLKWPNDVVRFQASNEGLAKLVGILIEVRQHAGQSRLVIGLGINQIGRAHV